jgi:hypothetical protein
MTKNNYDTRVNCYCDKCGFQAWYYQSQSAESKGEWKMSKDFVPHDVNCEGVKCKNKPHGFKATQLSPILHDSLRAEPNLSTKSAKNVASQYLSSNPTASFVKKVIKFAREDLYGSDCDQAALMMAIKAAMEKKGHIVNVYETGKEAQKQIIHEHHKKEHKQCHLESCKCDNIPKGDPCRKYKYEQPADLYQILDEFDDYAKFMYGYDFVFEHANLCVHY